MDSINKNQPLLMKVAKYISNHHVPINIVLCASMPSPTYWTLKQDLILIITLANDGFDNFESVRVNIQKYSEGCDPQINEKMIPANEWLSDRRDLLINEINELIIPAIFDPSFYEYCKVDSLPKFYEDIFRIFSSNKKLFDKSDCIKIMSKHQIKKLLFVIGYYGIDHPLSLNMEIENDAQKAYEFAIKNIILKSKMPYIAQSSVTQFVCSLMLKCNYFISELNFNTKVLTRMICSAKQSENDYDYDNIIKSIPNSVIYYVAKCLLFFSRLRKIRSKIPSDFITNFLKEKNFTWKAAPDWWIPEQDDFMIRFTSKYGFLHTIRLCDKLCKLQKSRTFTFMTNYHDLISNEKLRFPFPTLKRLSLCEFDFLYNFDTRIERITQILDLISENIDNINLSQFTKSKASLDQSSAPKQTLNQNQSILSSNQNTIQSSITNPNQTQDSIFSTFAHSKTQNPILQKTTTSPKPTQTEVQNSNNQNQSMKSIQPPNQPPTSIQQSQNTTSNLNKIQNDGHLFHSQNSMSNQNKLHNPILLNPNQNKTQTQTPTTKQAQTQLQNPPKSPVLQNSNLNLTQNSATKLNQAQNPILQAPKSFPNQPPPQQHQAPNQPSSSQQNQNQNQNATQNQKEVQNTSSSTVNNPKLKMLEDQIKNQARQTQPQPNQIPQNSPQRPNQPQSNQNQQKYDLTAKEIGEVVQKAREMLESIPKTREEMTSKTIDDPFFKMLADLSREDIISKFPISRPVANFPIGIDESLISEAEMKTLHLLNQVNSKAAPEPANANASTVFINKPDQLKRAQQQQQQQADQQKIQQQKAEQLKRIQQQQLEQQQLELLKQQQMAGMQRTYLTSAPSQPIPPQFPQSSLFTNKNVKANSNSKKAPTLPTPQQQQQQRAEASNPPPPSAPASQPPAKPAPSVPKDGDGEMIPINIKNGFTIARIPKNSGFVVKLTKDGEKSISKNLDDFDDSCPPNSIIVSMKAKMASPGKAKFKIKWRAFDSNGSEQFLSTKSKNLDEAFNTFKEHIELLRNKPTNSELPEPDKTALKFFGIQMCVSAEELYQAFAGI